MDTFLELVSVRLLRWLLVGVVVLFFFVPDAGHAATVPPANCGVGEPIGPDTDPSSSVAVALYCTRADALAACEVGKQNRLDQGYAGVVCTPIPYQSTYTELAAYDCARPDGSRPCEPSRYYWKQACPAGSVWDAATQTCSGCTGKPALTSGWLACPDSNTVNCPYNACVDSCLFSQDTLPDTATQNYRQVDGIWYASVSGYGPTGATCTVGSDPSLSNPPTDTDGDGVSDSNDTFPNDPGESVDSDGDGIGDNADFAPDDPNDGKDTPGDEDGDDEGDNAASGGGTCVSPPMCTGDGILCAIAFQTWATRCAAEKIASNTSGDGNGGSGGSGGENNGSATAGSGNCQVAPACSGGDAAQCALLLQQWRLACDSGDPEADTSGITETADGEVEGDPEGLFETQGWAQQMQEVQSNANGWAGRGSCPVSFTFSALGRSFDMDPTAWCDLMDVLAALVNLVAAIHAGFILASGLRRG